MDQTKKQSRVTLQDVAKDAEVSRSTASLVLNDSDRIPEGTKRRVRASIEKLGYIYNHKAASLRTQRSQTVGVIVTDLSNPFYAELIRGINRGLQANGYAALLGDSRRPPGDPKRHHHEDARADGRRPHHRPGRGHVG